ncbi:MAG: site-specific integrase [Clostridia bacterium]|nr:site-specific integrase [Clostridia bacterium]
MVRRKNGNGTIRHRGDGRWEGRIVVGYDEKGLPKTKNVLAKTKTECREKLEKLKNALADHAEKAMPDMTFGAYIDFWYRTFTSPKLKETTREKYESEIYGHIIPRLGNIPLCELKHSDMEKFYAEQKKNGRQTRREIYGDGLSNAVVRSIHARCRSALDRAVKDGLIIRNPASDCALPPKKSPEMKILYRDEIRRFLIQAKFEGLYEMFLLDLSTGMRRGELLGLRWEDLEFDTGDLSIRREIALVRGKMTVSSPKTKTSTRVIKLPPSVVEALKEYRKKVDSKWMFPSPVDSEKPREPSACRKRLSHILERAECKHVRFHDLRHTFATMALEGGMDIKTLSTVIGHSTAATTLNTYSHITSDMQRKAALRIDRAIARSGDLPSETTDESNDSPEPRNARTEPDFTPRHGKKRLPGTGCISRVSPNTWQGKYTPRAPDGRREIHAVYAKTEEECEKLLAEMIAKIKAENAPQ